MNQRELSGLGLDGLLDREWLVTNGLGGYASATLPGLNSRKYHGLLVAAMAPPVHRMVLLSRVEETVHLRGWPFALACNEYPGTIHPAGHELLKSFSHEPYPRWAYQADGWTLEKSVRLLRGQNTVLLTYTLLGTAPSPDDIELELRPLMALRPIHELTYQWNGTLEAQSQGKGRHRVPPTSRTPELFFAHDGQFNPQGVWYFNTIYRREQDRGYAGLEDLWSPGLMKWKLRPGKPVHFVCSTDPVDVERTLAALEAESTSPKSPNLKSQIGNRKPEVTDGDTILSALTRAAGQFAVDLPPERRAEIGLLTQYPWASPSAREALIAMPGILLVTGKFQAARSLLLALVAKLRRGLIPTRFPEDGAQPVYCGADTSLWFINALWHYLRYTGDEALIQQRLLDVILGIIETYRHGTDLGINVDAQGLLASHEPGIGTTWMDAKVGDWVITPRAGRPVELNALWYNAMRIAVELCEHFGRSNRAIELRALATSIAAAFNKRFWNEPEGCCFDVIDDHGPDPAVRPNQLLALSLPFAVLSIEKHPAVLQKVRSELLTPRGLRTLSPRDPSYQPRYRGNVVSRERAAHQGSAYPWLLGPFITATLRVAGRGENARADALQTLSPCVQHLHTDGLGQLCELFDADPPHRPGGAIASAPAVGEILRAYVEDVLDQGPANAPPLAKPTEIAPTVMRPVTRS